MKALTIRQPWASLVILGVKTMESRSWRTAYRGEIAVHAGRTFGRAERYFAQGAVALPYLLAARLDPNSLPRGVVLGTVMLEDCKSVDELYEFIQGRAGARERLLGDYGPGRFGWILRHPTAFAEPVPAAGALSLWNWHR
jgi:activating signal cointegrator 1